MLFHNSFVDDVFAFALTALDTSGLHQFDIGCDRQHAFELGTQHLFQCTHSSDVVVEEGAAHLILNLECVEVLAGCPCSVKNI